MDSTAVSRGQRLAEASRGLWEHSSFRSSPPQNRPAGQALDYGVALKRLDRLDEAERAYRKVVELDPSWEGGWANLGGLLRRQGRYEEAKQTYRTAVGLKPDDPRLWDDFGHLLSAVGPPEEAERIWEEALRLHPTLAPCAIHLLEARLERGVPEEAVLREAEKWIESAGRSARVLDSMSRFVLSAKLTEALPRAENWAREGLSKTPRERVAETLPLACAAQGNWMEAIQSCGPLLDAALDVEPARKAATELLIQAAAEGHAREALDMLTRSKGASVLEPLVAGLRIHLGEKPHGPREILEVGQDVAERITEYARAASALPAPQ